MIWKNRTWDILFFFFVNSVVTVSEVEALFEMFKDISGSMADDGLISKVTIKVKCIVIQILYFVPLSLFIWWWTEFFPFLIIIITLQ